MSYYAFVRDGQVVDVIRADQNFVDLITQQELDRNPAGTGQWLQTSYNTHAGQHTQGGTPLRKNFAAIGYLYDAVADAFYPPRPYDTWILDPDTYQWSAPVAYPDDGNQYRWDPVTNNWIEWTLGE
jgi:hypothetical protein